MIMKSLIVFLAIIGFALSACPGDTRAAFISFKRSFARKYNSSSDEENKYGVFRKNLIEIEAHNARYEAGLETYSKGVDQFTDMTTEEFQASMTLKPLQAEMYDNITHYQTPARANIPAYVNYLEQGACTDVKDQGDCGSCWAYAAVGCLESHIFLRGGGLYSLSADYLIECNKKNKGCDGGKTGGALAFIAENGIFYDHQWEEEGKFDTEICSRNAKKVAGLTDWAWVLPESEKSLEQAVATKGPIAVGIDASEWRGYHEGIFQTRKSDIEIGHAVVVVGYGEEKGIKYWLIRNSWGTDWGEKGYIRIRKGIDQIGIAEEGIFPTFST